MPNTITDGGLGTFRPAASRHAIRMLGAAVIAMLLLAPAPTPAAETPLPNQMCPVLTNEAADPSISATYRGKKVYFCCSLCRKQFLESPEKYQANLPQFASMVDADRRSGGHAERPIAHGQGDPHDHDKDHAPGGIVAFLGKFHPVVIHFPIALILLTGLSELIGMATGRRFFVDVGRFLLPLGAVSAVVSMLLGLAAESGARFPDELAGYLQWHEILGIITTVLAGVAAVLGELRHRLQVHWATWAYRAALGLAITAVGITGHLGAALVFGPDHFSV